MKLEGVIGVTTKGKGGASALPQVTVEKIRAQRAREGEMEREKAICIIDLYTYVLFVYNFGQIISSANHKGSGHYW